MSVKDIDAATGETIKQVDWRPQRPWTAWPMNVDRVPPDDFMHREECNNDGPYTIRQASKRMPSAALEEALSATILRSAKEKFNSRPWEENTLPGPLFEEEDDDEEVQDGLSESDSEPYGERGTSRRSRSRSKLRVTSVKLGTVVVEKGKQVDIESDDSTNDDSLAIPLHERVLEPTVITDDQLSHDLMRPTVRSILANFDATLMVLHHSRGAAVSSHLSDSSDDSESERPSKKRRGRPARAGLALRLRTPPPPPVESHENLRQDPTEMVDHGSEADIEGPPPKRKGGRPRKVYPRLDGESDKEWAIRVARLRKEPIPFFKDAPDSGDPASKVSDSSAGTFRATKRKPLRSRGSSPQDSPTKKARKRENARRLGLRDWKDVLGAAAIAGFPQTVLDRAARRCADLFGGSMELHMLNGDIPENDGQDKRVQYHPGTVPDLAEELTDIETDQSEDGTQSQVARHIRGSSVASASSGPRGRSRSRSRSVSRVTTRSRSRSASVAGTHFCSVRGCERSTEGFTRRANLIRHMKLVHDVEEGEVQTEVDSADEMYGAVHVDGYMKPIKLRKGWRGDDIRRSRSGSSKRLYAGRYKKRATGRTGSTTGTGDEDRDVVMGEN